MTFGEFKKLNVPDETPLVIRAWDDVAYLPVDGTQIVVASAGNATLPVVRYFDPTDRRALGNAKQVLLVGLG